MGTLSGACTEPSSAAAHWPPCSQLILGLTSPEPKDAQQDLRTTPVPGARTRLPVVTRGSVHQGSLPRQVWAHLLVETLAELPAPQARIPRAQAGRAIGGPQPMPPLKTVPLVQQLQAGKMLRCDCSERGWVAPADAWAATGSVWGGGEGAGETSEGHPMGMVGTARILGEVPGRGAGLGESAQGFCGRSESTSALAL